MVHAHGGVVSSWLDKFHNQMLHTPMEQEYDPGKKIECALSSDNEGI